MATMKGTAEMPRGRNERALLAAARAGDRRAFEQLVGTRRNAVRRHCRRILRCDDDAEDATQETMLRAWRALPRFEGRASLGSWLHTIATNACLNAIAKRRQRIAPVDDEPVPLERSGPARGEVALDSFDDAVAGLELVGPRTPDVDLEEREGAKLALATALAPLPPLQRNVLVLRYVVGYSARETADHLATSVAATNSALQRARATAAVALATR